MNYLKLLNNDIWRYHILPKLKLKDQYILHERGYVEYSLLMEVIKTKIKISDVVNKLIKEYGGYLSGSSLLKMINDEPWDSNDIDIYVNNLSDIIKYIKYNGFEYKTSVEHSVLYAKAKYTKYIDRIITLSTNGIQLIVIKDIDIKQFILNAFDFTILKNYYYYHHGKYILTINHFDDIISRKLVFDVDALNYLQPEFSIGYKDVPANTYVTRERIEKYISRGFKVDLGDIHEDAKCLQHVFMGENIKCYKCYVEGSNGIRTLDGETLDTKFIKIPCQKECWVRSCFKTKHRHIHIIKQEEITKLLTKKIHHGAIVDISSSDVVIFT